MKRHKPSDVFRIAIVGDSITMGSRVREEQAYPALLESWLNLRFDTPKFEVLNLGIAEFGATRLAKVGMPFDPDLIVYGFTENDLQGVHYRGRKNAPLWNVEWQKANELAFDLPRFLRSRLYSVRELIRPPVDSYIRELDLNYFENPEAWSDFDGALERIATTGREREICVLMLVHTDLHFLHFLHPMRRHYRAAERAASEHGISVKQTFPYFRGRDAPSPWVSGIDYHPNLEGHEILARALLDGIEALPNGCWPLDEVGSG